MQQQQQEQQQRKHEQGQTLFALSSRHATCASGH
jgi:hypothetical protein